jgi:hypothetical protein
VYDAEGKKRKEMSIEYSEMSYWLSGLVVGLCRAWDEVMERALNEHWRMKW